ncbi:uncharacterized protein BYT42DRAFT_545096 [Radiomyces spectabilis]|uniref:uncharacterized protein n=1 Tax=Radiomyces spectabilis TaxID=64574 RepID=UPI0022204704|nr:uncharacterized protein BYT42DRAFT_545096 [Radiomyces spectabilis]KAI8381161.1 hypothetical protein BYT42DRAFT_545096 [Radiomyces spectabilis]
MNSDSYATKNCRCSAAFAFTDRDTLLYAMPKSSGAIWKFSRNNRSRILLAIHPQHSLSLGILEAILSPLFEYLDNNIAFRWTSVSDDEKQANIRSDASINIIHGAMLDDRFGCGELRGIGLSTSRKYQLSEPVPGPGSPAYRLDLFHIAALAKDASDKHKLKSTFAFP